MNSCWRLVDEPTIRREIDGLGAAKAALPNAEGVLVYHDAPVDIERRIPEAMPAWRWLLAQPVRGVDTPPLSP